MKEYIKEREAITKRKHIDELKKIADENNNVTPTPNTYLYRSIHSRAQRLCMPVSEYVESLGFTLASIHDKSRSREEIREELLKRRIVDKEGNITNFIYISSKDNLYFRIRNLNIDIKDFGLEKATKKQKLLIEEGVSKCSTCKKILPSSMFYKSKGISNGLLSQCKECTRVSNMRYKREKIVRVAYKGEKYTVIPLCMKFKGKIWVLEVYDVSSKDKFLFVLKDITFLGDEESLVERRSK